MEKWILTISENKYDSVMTYVIDEQSIPLGLTVEDIVLKIISKIVIDTPEKMRLTMLKEKMIALGLSSILVIITMWSFRRRVI